MTEPHSPSPLASKSFRITSSKQPTCKQYQPIIKKLGYSGLHASVLLIPLKVIRVPATLLQCMGEGMYLYFRG